MTGKLRVALLLGCAALLLGAAPASASTVSIEGGTILQVRADKDPVNDMKIGLVPGNLDDYRITDASSDIFPTGNCLAETDRSIRCPSRGVTSVSVFLSNGGDRFAVLEPAGIAENVRLTVRGGLGDDQIDGRNTAGPEFLFGNDGNDVVTAHCPGDGKNVNGGPGNDLLTICGAAKASSLASYGMPRLASIRTTASLTGEGGNDKLTGGPESDLIKGGPGNDVAKGKGRADIIDCGGGKHDLGVGGGGVDLGKNCEKVKH
jgi:Ca2+-binding RTX toxin-like protein